MQRTKLNAHTDASGNLCACSPIRLGVTRKNEWHGISGASACRCEICGPRPMYGTQRWLLGIDNSLINALHIVDDQSERERVLDYVSHGVIEKYDIVTRLDILLHIIEALKDCDWMLFFVWKIS